jgi:hypothetical protein
MLKRANAKLGALIIVVGCAGPAQQAAPQPGSQGESATQPSRTPDPQAGMVAGAPSTAAPAAPAKSALPAKNQPPHIKLKLGHYRNEQLGIGVTIDLTEMTENVADIDPAKLRFDGETKVWKLQGQNGPQGRIDYLDGKRVILHVWDNGRRAVYVPDPDTGRSSDEISVYRDGDADPL